MERENQPRSWRAEKRLRSLWREIHAEAFLAAFL
jgi:hypothetical protein